MEKKLLPFTGTITALT